MISIHPTTVKTTTPRFGSQYSLEEIETGFKQIADPQTKHKARPELLKACEAVWKALELPPAALTQVFRDQLHAQILVVPARLMAKTPSYSPDELLRITGDILIQYGDASVQTGMNAVKAVRGLS